MTHRNRERGWTPCWQNKVSWGLGSVEGELVGGWIPSVAFGYAGDRVVADRGAAGLWCGSPGNHFT